MSSVNGIHFVQVSINVLDNYLSYPSTDIYNILRFGDIHPNESQAKIDCYASGGVKNRSCVDSVRFGPAYQIVHEPGLVRLVQQVWGRLRW